MRMSSLFAAAAFAMAPQVAFAACELEPAPAVPILPQMVGKTVAEAIPPSYLEGLKARLPSCSEAEIVSAFLAANNWQADTRLQEGATIRAVRLKTAATVPAAAPAAAQANVVQSQPQRGGEKVADGSLEMQRQIDELERRIAASPAIAQAKVEQADLERAVQSFLRSNPIRSEWTPAQTTSFNKAQTRLDNLEGKIASLEAALAKKADKSYVDAALAQKADAASVNAGLANKANVGDSYTKEETDLKFASLPAGESLPWWVKLLIAVSAIGAILGTWAFFRKQPESAAPDLSGYATSEDLKDVNDQVAAVSAPDLSGFATKEDLAAFETKVGEMAAPDLSRVATKEDLAVLSAKVEEMGHALPADIRLQSDWHEQLEQLQEGDTVELEVLVRGEEGSYDPKFTVDLKKGSDGEIFCVGGIKGQNAQLTINAAKFEATVRRAGFNNRLNNPVGLREAA